MSAALHPAHSHSRDPARLDCARCGELLSGPGLECSFCRNPDGRRARLGLLLGPAAIAVVTLLLLHLIAIVPAAYWDGTLGR